MLNTSVVDNRRLQDPVTERALTARLARKSVSQTYATPDDFQQLFAKEMTDLFDLSFRLTANAEKAECCLIFAMRDCFENSNNVAKNSVRIRGRRSVIRNAIRLVLGKKNSKPDDIASEAASGFYLQPSEYRIEELRESLAVLDLPDFDRLVFVICVLERYSILDCALLMRKSPKDVNNARVRAINQIIEAEGWNRLVGSNSTWSGCSCGGKEFDSSCGTLLD
jgi:hypothetical protein